MTINMDHSRDPSDFCVLERCRALLMGLFMHDTYQVPALILTTLLLPAFGRLFLRSRDLRTLLWFLALVFTTLRLVLLYAAGAWELNYASHPWSAAASQSCGLLSSGFILASLSPLKLRIGKVRVLYVIPYIIPMIVYAILAYGVFHGVAPAGPLYWVFPALAAISLIIGLLWNFEKGNLPIWISALACIAFGGVAMWFCIGRDLFRPLQLAQSGNHLVAALLVLFVFRRRSSGVTISFLGLLGWACPILLAFPLVRSHPNLDLTLIRVIVMANVVTALG